MARTRKTSKEALEEKIEKAEADVIAAKKKYRQIKTMGDNSNEIPPRILFPK